MRHDIFKRVDSIGPFDTGEWSLYVEAVTPANAKRIASTLEADGERVLICTHHKTLGKFVYETR